MGLVGVGDGDGLALGMVGWVGIFEHSGMGWDWDGLRIFGH